MKPAQVRMARAGLGWSVEELAARAGVRAEDVTDYEGESFVGSEDRLLGLQRTLEAAGIEFTDEGAPGVRLRPKAEFIPTEELNAENDD